MQCQEFEPWGAGDIFGHGAACCRAKLSFTVGSAPHVSLVTHCSAVIHVESLRSVSTDVERFTHNPPQRGGVKAWLQKDVDIETLTVALQFWRELCHFYLRCIHLTAPQNTSVCQKPEILRIFLQAAETFSFFSVLPPLCTLCLPAKFQPEMVPAATTPGLQVRTLRGSPPLMNV